MTRDDMIIRAVRQDDFATWLPLWDGYNEFYGRVGPTALTPEVTALTWSRLLDPAVPMQALVAEQDGKLLGITHYLYHLGTMQAETICYLSDLFTVPAARGKGVGGKLITAVYDAAGAAGGGPGVSRDHSITRS